MLSKKITKLLILFIQVDYLLDSYKNIMHYKLSNCAKSPLPPFTKSPLPPLKKRGMGSRSNVICFLYKTFRNNLTDRDKQLYQYQPRIGLVEPNSKFLFHEFADDLGMVKCHFG